MPRPAAGPRQLDSTGTWYAVKTVKGKRHSVSLGTKSKPEAMRRWPSVMAELEASLQPTKHHWNDTVEVTEWDVDTGKSSTYKTRADYILPPSQLDYSDDVEGITWAQAETIAAKRYERRKGKAVSRSWRYQIKNALRHMPLSSPAAVKPSDVRKMVEAMEERGYQATTVAQRCSCLSGVIEALIRGGHLDDTHINPFSRVDTAATGTRHHYKPSPSDYQEIWARREGMNAEAINTLKLLMFTGVRIGEAINGVNKDGCLFVEKQGDWSPKNRASQRVIPLPKDLHGLAVCPSEDSFRRQFEKIRDGHPASAHSWRHGFASAGRAAEADHIVMERYLGHSIPKMAATYGEFSQAVLEREAVKTWQVIDQWVLQAS